MTYVRHGLRSLPEYQVWADIKKRCENPKHRQYKDYGGRGISICDEWRLDFSRFYKDLGPRPEGATIERRNVDADYCPENCHWEVDRGVQAFNTTLHGSNKSGKAGVMWDSQRNLWQAFIYKNKKRYFLGRFSDLDEAILARRDAELLHYGFHKSA